MSYTEIKFLIKSKNPDVDDLTLKYFADYFFVAVNKGLLPPSVTLDKAIETAFIYASKIVFYDENHEVYKFLGGDVKGYRNPADKTIYIRNNLPEPLREITVYHELHHAVQTNPKTDEVGINQESNMGRMIMEAQTQYMAELIYSEIHGVTFEEREIPSEELRMLPEGRVVSKLHNYELYDCMLSKLAILLGVPKEYFVTINYLVEDNEGLKDFEARYDAAKERLNLKATSYSTLYMLDYIYCVDLLAYTDNPAKEHILSGRETEGAYEIYPDKLDTLSLAKQRSMINLFDANMFLDLFDANVATEEFARYIIDNDKRALAMQILGDEEPGRK